MENKKIYTIQINGIKESIDAVDALNKQLNALESRIKALESANVKVASTPTAGASSTSNLSQDVALQKELNSLKNEGTRLDAKIEAAQTEIYKRVQATKDIYKETINDQKQLAANERLAANAYSNTMMGMKQKLADLKTMINTTDLGDSDKLKQMTKEANELTNKLKEMEEAYGQFGRNVGNYKSAADGFNRIKVAVGDTVREYDNYRQAAKVLKEERFQLANSVGQEAQAYKDVDIALKRLESDYQDLNKSSKIMDTLLDTMHSFAGLASIGQGLSTLFGIDDADFQNSMQKIVALSLVLQGIEAVMQDIQKQEGFIAKGFGKIVDVSNKLQEKFENIGYSLGSFAANLRESDVEQYFVAVEGEVDEFGEQLYMLADNAPKRLKNMEKAFKAVGVAAKWTARVIMSAFTFGLLLVLPEILSFFGKVKEGLNSTKVAAEHAAEQMNTLNQQLQARRDILSSSYLKGAINEEEYLANVYKEQSDALVKQIDLLKKRAEEMAMEEDSWFSPTKHNTEFSSQSLTEPVTVEYGKMFGTDFSYTVKNVQELEKAWKECNQAVEEGKDYFSKWGKGLLDWASSLWVTVNDTKEVMRGLGNIKLSDFVADFQRVNAEFADTKNAEKYAKELQRLKKEMNGNEILTSVIANLDKYIPDDGVREAVQSIINEITKLDNAFNMTSPEQIHYWNQVRIEGMKEGWKKTKAQIDENERWEIQQYGKTQEQISMIQQKYAQQRASAREKVNKDAASKNKEWQQKARAAEDEYQRLTIALMKDGLEKQIKQLDEEKRQKLRKINDNGVRVKELSELTEQEYEKRLVEIKQAWAKKTEQVYIDMWTKIYQINHNAQQTDFENQLRDLETNYKQLQEKASEIITEVSDSTITKDDKRYLSTISEDFKLRLANRKKYYEDAQKLSIDNLTKQRDIEESAAIESMNDELRNLRSRYLIEDEELKNHLKNGEITQEKYNEATVRLGKERVNNEAAIEEKYYSESKARLQKYKEDVKKVNAKYMEDELGEYERHLNDLSELDSSTPVIGWTSFINYEGTKKRNNDLVKNYKDTFDKIQTYIKNLEARKKEFDPIDFDRLMTNAKDAQKSIIQIIKNIEENTKIAGQELAQQIVSFIDQSMQQINSIIGSLSEITSNRYEAQISEQEKYIEEYEKLLDKQAEITRDHADKVNDIEDELKNARGDRRQQLIDNLNAEMAAQRASLAQQKKIEKEEEKAKEKKKKLEHDQAVAKKKMDLAQAYINAAMAVSMAAVNHWPVPAIPMMALAAAAGAAQIAAVQSQNIPSYGDGGVIQGKSHAQGGIKVLGGRAEVEGGEFITNKVTTSKNVELLDFINSKKKRVNIDDMIEFYGNGTVRKNIQTVRTKFENGGQIPTLRSDISFDDRLLSAFEDYSNRPSIVSVVDILDRSQAVKNVQVIAGLSE